MISVCCLQYGCDTGKARKWARCPTCRANPECCDTRLAALLKQNDAGILAGIFSMMDRLKNRILALKLTDTILCGLKATDKVQKHSDGGGLYIHVAPTGGKLWRMNYRFNDRQKTLSFGAYPAVSLEDARAKRDEAKRLLVNRIDPGEAKKDVKGVSRFAAEIQFMRDKITEIASLAAKNRLSLEVSIGVRATEPQGTEADIQHIGTIVINCSGKE